MSDESALQSKQPVVEGCRVAVVYRFLPQYRREFYDLLRAKLSDEGVDLSLFAGDGDASDRAKGDLIELEWSQSYRNRIVTLFGKSLYWQPVLRKISGAHLVIVEQASRLLVNYVLQAGQYFGGPKVALWGHGKNFQARTSDRLGEWIKAQSSVRAHWWFAYNRLSAEIVESLGFPSDRITVVQNAIDTTSLAQAVAELLRRDTSSIRRRLGVTSKHVGTFIGGLYEDKCLAFLFEASARIRELVPDFQLVVAGDGNQRSVVEEAARQNPWIRYVGPQFGVQKAELLAVSTVCLVPGAVGLTVLDSFASGVPLVTTQMPFHGPEISYLESGRNGVMTRHDVGHYANAVRELFDDQKYRNEVAVAARASSDRYTVENMVANFASGVISALRRGPLC